MAENYVLWLVAGIALVIAELLTGTFVLLMLGLAAFAGAAAAWWSDAFWVQALSAVVVAVAGFAWLQARRRRGSGPAMKSLDIGQPVTLDSWINAPARRARVRYRDALWEAAVEQGPADPPAVAGDVFYIVAMDGNTLSVARQLQPTSDKHIH